MRIRARALLPRRSTSSVARGRGNGARARLLTLAGPRRRPVLDTHVAGGEGGFRGDIDQRRRLHGRRQRRPRVHTRRSGEEGAVGRFGEDRGCGREAEDSGEEEVKREPRTGPPPHPSGSNPARHLLENR